MMQKVSLIGCAMVWGGVLAVPALGQETTKPAQGPAAMAPTIDQSLEWQSAFNPKLSPDGKRVVYEVQKTNWEENAFERNLWIGEIASGETHALTTAKKSSTNPEWSPDGKRIALDSEGRATFTDSPESKKGMFEY